ncbi:hypothetical protein ACFXPZ_06850 [Streptomyces sp. NPDC059101]|uniref:hypothetical protein n=1 Tax=Streptomyces sp. NPDC059101 TaxID=3346728 RepID=UPI0036A4DEED
MPMRLAGLSRPRAARLPRNRGTGIDDRGPARHPGGVRVGGTVRAVVRPQAAEAHDGDGPGRATALTVCRPGAARDGSALLVPVGRKGELWARLRKPRWTGRPRYGRFLAGDRRPARVP